MSTMNYLDRFLEPMTDVFTLELAHKFSELRADPRLQAEVDALADKANQGTLTAEEDYKYKCYIEAADIMAIMQAKARRFLANYAAKNG